MAIDVAKLLITVGSDITGAEKGLNKVSDRLDNFAAKSQYAGKILSVGLTAPLVAFGTMATMAASDLSESMNKVNVVFEESSGEISEFAQDARTQLGISEQAALEATGTFGNLFVTMGLTQDEAADMSTSIVTLAADLASFNNIDPGVALEKLRAGLVGEVEPLRALGVNVQESTVQLKAMEMGLAATAAELTNQDKVMARYALIMEQTKTAQGDFARTSDGLANMMRITKATVTDAAAAFGEVLLPYVVQGVTFVKDLIQQVIGLDDAQKRSIVTWGAVAAAAGPALLVLSTMAKIGSGAIQAAVGLGGAITTLGNNLVATQAAYRAGLTLTTSLQVGFGAAAAALGPLAIALGVVVGGYLLYNATIGKTAKELQVLQAVKMDEFFKRQEQVVTTAHLALSQYLQVYTQLNQEMKKADLMTRVAGIFARDAGDMKQSAQELGLVIAELGGDWDDYREAVFQANREMGHLGTGTKQAEVDYSNLSNRQQESIAKMGLMSKAEFEAAKEAAVLNAIIEKLGGTSAIVATGMDASNSQIERFIQDAKLFSPAVQQMTEEQKALAEAAEATAMALVQVGLSGELQSGIETYTETITRLRDEYAALSEAAVGWAPGSAKVQELADAMGANATEQERATAAMREATTQMIFQQAAAGLDAQSTLTLARAMGVLSEQDYAVAQTVQNLKTSFTGLDGVMDPSEAAGYATAIEGVNQAVQNLVTAGLPVTFENIGSELQKAADWELASPDISQWTTMGTEASGAITGIKTAFETTITTLPATATTAATGIKTAFTGEDWSAVGVGVAAGMAAGIVNGTPQVEAAARLAAQKALAAAMAELGIQSPSKKFAMIGEQTMAGMAQGIRKNAALPVREAAYAAAASTAGATYYSTYSPSVSVSANVASEIDIYRMAQVIADEIRTGRL